MIDRDMLTGPRPIGALQPDDQVLQLGREILRLRAILQTIHGIAHHGQYKGARPDHAYLDAQLLNSMLGECRYQARQGLLPYDGRLTPPSFTAAAAILGGDLFVLQPAQDRITDDWRRKQAEGWAAWHELQNAKRADFDRATLRIDDNIATQQNPAWNNRARPVTDAQGINSLIDAATPDIARTLYADDPKAKRRAPVWQFALLMLLLFVLATAGGDWIGGAIGRAIKGWLS